jgi:chorismate mutase
MKHEVLRLRIRAIDKTLIHLLHSRMQISRRIGKLKTFEGLPVFDRDQERRVITRAQKWARGLKEDEAFVTSLMRTVIKQSKKVQSTP